MARDQGVGEEEIGAVQAIVMAVSAGRIGAQLEQVGRTGQGGVHS